MAAKIKNLKGLIWMKLWKNLMIVGLLIILLSAIVWGYVIYVDDPCPANGVPNGEKIDDGFRGVKIYKDKNISGVNKNDLRFQCVEYCRRFYIRVKKKDLGSITDRGKGIEGVARNAIITRRRDKKGRERGWGDLMIHRNDQSKSRPNSEDILVFGGNGGVGHVAIITSVDTNDNGNINFVQQNVPGSPSGNVTFQFNEEKKIHIDDYGSMPVLGWLTDDVTQLMKFKIDSTEPEDGAENVAVSQVVKITFNSDLANQNFQQLIDVKPFYLASKFHVGVSGGNQLTIKNSRGWTPGIKYTITLHHLIRNNDGSTLHKDDKKRIFSFRIEPRNSNQEFELIIESPVHHLGDDRYNTPVNVGFVKMSEGIHWSKVIYLPDDLMNRDDGYLVVNIRGAQKSSLYLNGVLIGKLRNTLQDNGKAQAYKIPKGVVKRGKNVVRIISHLIPHRFLGVFSEEGKPDNDDLEFHNLTIFFGDIDPHVKP